MKMKVLYGLSAVIMLVMLSSCSKVPQAEIDNARLAIEAAQTAQADVYVPEQFAALQDSFNAVNESIETQKSKWFRSFKAEKEKLAAINTQAEQVKMNAEARMNEVKAEVVATIDEIKSLQEMNNQLVTQAPKGKEGAAAIEAIKADLTVVDAAIIEAQQMFDNGDFMAALNKVNAAKEKAYAINAELKEVMEKYAKMKGGRK